MSGWWRRLPWARVPRDRGPVAASETENSEGEDGKTALAIESVKQAYVDTHKDDKRNELIRRIVDAVTIISLIVTVIYTIRTFHVFDQQLNVMQKAIVAAHDDAAVAVNDANNNAENALVQADGALTASNQTDAIHTEQTNRALGIAQNNADATANEAGAVTGQLAEMKSEQRAWMKVDAIEVQSTGGPFNPGGGLFFPAKGIPGGLPLIIRVKNVGRSPALNVRVGAYAIFGHFELIPNLLSFEEDRCSGLDQMKNITPSMFDNIVSVPVIFPNDSYTFDQTGVLIDQNKMIEISSKHNGIFTLWFYGCIRYLLPGSDAPHSTSFMYSVLKKGDAAFTPWVNVPAVDIILSPRPMGEGIND